MGGDFYSAGRWTSDGYNRVAVYGTGTSNSSWMGAPVPNTDKENNSWTTATFYGTETLAINIYNHDDTKPPHIGAKRIFENGTIREMNPNEEFRLLTLMLSENKNLALTDRATNIIDVGVSGQYPRYDERGADRRASGLDLDIGPVLFGGIPPSDDIHPRFDIAYVQISGIPNSIRRIGQTVGLIAKVYYTNGRSALGGTGTNNEPVTWSATPAGYLKVNSATGVITAMRLTTGESYVTLKCQTVRAGEDGNPVTAIARIKIDPALDYAELNNSPESGHYNTVQIIRDLCYEFEEYNMGYGLIDKNIEIVQSYNYQDILEIIYGVDQARAIATTAGNYDVTTSENNALTYVVNVENASEGDVTAPIIYLCSFTGDELKSIFGQTFNISSILAADDTPIDIETASKLFKTLKVEFKGENVFTLPILGSNSSINVADAVNKGALEVTNNAGGIDIKLNLMVANVGTNESNKLEISESSNSELKGAIIVPDGSNDDKISGSIVFPQKQITADENIEAENNNQQTAATTTQTATTPNNSENSSGGSSGCNLGLGLLSLSMLALLFMKRHG